MSTNAETTMLVDRLLEHLAEEYIFPERAGRAAALIRARLEGAAYSDADGPELCARISADLLDACDDKHLRLIWHETPTATPDEAELHAALRLQIRRENHGVRRVELLPDNIGLIELTIIPEPASGGPNLAAAMQLVENTDALIFDLRPTRGGSPDGVVFLASYLFADGDVHLSDFTHGANGPTRQYWTSAYVPGPRYLDRPVYLLTSPITFSGGEAFAYDLQAQGRALVVGETTRGGAHPSIMVALTAQIELRLPVARSINTVTKTNWESVGVQPDISAPAPEALEVARQTALSAITEDADAVAA
jgi:C-terminal processing protease CtpA/Prc